MIVGALPPTIAHEQAAFGPHPGAYPLPPATTAQSRWWRAVALGGQGRYGAAETELTRLLRRPAGSPYYSLAASTRGSHLRQLGQHAAARPLDALAVCTAVDAPAGQRAAAWCDGLLGLAADALGSGQVDLARRLLARCEPTLDASGWRGRLRWYWVSAETALCAGELTTAQTHAAGAESLARQCPSVRHLVKSRLVQAAALGRDGGAPIAAAVLTQARERGLLPLQWAATMLLTALGQGPDTMTTMQVAAELAESTELLARRGTRPR